MNGTPRYPGTRITTNGNQLVAYHTEARITDGGVFYPITPSTEMGENYQLSFAEGKLNVFGGSKLAVETEGEHSAQGGAIAFSVCGKRTVNFTSGQGIVYGSEQYYHAPGKFSTMILEVSARALTKHALNVHCGHDDIYAVMDTGWIMLFGKDSQQAADQALIIRKVAELSLTPGINIQDGFLTSHLERTFFRHEAELMREFLGAPDDLIDCPNDAQRTLFGPKRRRVPRMIDLQNPLLLGPVQNQEHYMNGVVAHRSEFCEPILPMLEAAYAEFGELTGRRYGLLSRYRCEDAETVFVSLGSAAENIEAAVDYLREKGEKAGSIHVNVLRPAPEAAYVAALAGKKNVLVMERTDQPLAGDNPLARDIRTAFTKAVQAGTIGPAEVPRFFSGIYGLGSRDFRPEGILGAYGFATGSLARKDGHTEADGTTLFVVGVDHPYEVKAAERPSLLPHGAIAVRLHSIGGWGMITTGKNLGEIIGELGDHVAERDGAVDELGDEEVVHVSANPKYGSEKKGAPTEYFLVVAPERIRVNCDLRHVTVVLCCDPKAFTHTNPLDGMDEGGAFVWESDESPETAWTRIPRKYRQEILDKKIRLYTLPGFDIARAATERPDLQLRMQGNAFLGAFFAVSPFLAEFGIGRDHFNEQVEKQYKKKFGRFGDAVVASNMEVMLQGFSRVKEIVYGAVDAPDRSSMRGVSLAPLAGCETHCLGVLRPAEQEERAPVFRRETFDREYRAGLGYHQPASTLAAAGVVAAATGNVATKYVARRQTPIFLAENCTQCMECITSCPDTALPNTAQDLMTILTTAVRGYVTDPLDRARLLSVVPDVERSVRAGIVEAQKTKAGTPVRDLVRTAVEPLPAVSEESKAQLLAIFDTLPLAYNKVNAIFANLEKKTPGAGGIFSIFVSDLCKGCGECVLECGDHEALKMVDETEELNAKHATAVGFLNLLADTPKKYLGLYDPEKPQSSREAALRNHLMVRSSYDALVSGDGACAGCGEKTVLHAVASVTEAYMRPLYHAKADRLGAKAKALAEGGATRLAALKEKAPAEHALYVKAVAHLLMGLGGETDEDTDVRLASHGPIADAEIVDALRAVLSQEAWNHRELQAIDGRLANGMSVMAMGAHTGCNTVFGSTPPNNPHPYPWMNSLFQDGATVAWLFGEAFVQDHARRSVIPERLADALLSREENVMTSAEYLTLSHFGDALMTDLEVAELPKAWAIGGDGGMGDIGFQNVSKVVLQNRPNVKLLMLDTQVYSNTGGQNSDSSVITGGFDMNQIGAATQGKLTEKKGLAEIFCAGHGSPFVAQVSMANAPKMYKAILDALEYRGTAFVQSFTPCQPEHGVGDDVSTLQSQRARDCRMIPEFTYNPGKGETYREALEVKGNPNHDKDWWETTLKSTGEKVRYTVAHYAVTEARFRQHLRKVTPEKASTMVALDDVLVLLSQDDVVKRRVLDPKSPVFVPDFGVVIKAEDHEGRPGYYSLSRQMVLLCVERRKAWRLLQSKAGIDNKEYRAQRALLARLAKGEVTRDDLLKGGAMLLREEVTKLASS